MALWDISVETANEIYTWGWRLSLGGAVVTAIGVGLLMLGTRVRDHDFEKQVGELHSSAAKSEAETERLKSTNLELAATVEREKAARLRIESGLSPRHIKPEQIVVLVNALRGLQLSATISTYSEAEAAAYAAEIASALQSAGVRVQQGGKIISASSYAHGVFVEENAPEKLIAALISSGIAQATMTSKKDVMLNTGEGTNVIFVGLKPNPF